MAMHILSNTNTIGASNDRVFKFVNSVFGEQMHLKRVDSLANAAIVDGAKNPLINGAGR